jgi:predicted nucleic acid-binding protein
MRQVILDTGPLVALMDRQDRHHLWVQSQLKNLTFPLLTAEAVIIETCFLLQRQDSSLVSLVFNALKNGFISIPFVLDQEHQPIHILLEKYASVPMSVADACLVRMSETWGQAHVFTLDSDFRIYRKNRNEIIPCIIPDQR